MFRIVRSVPAPVLMVSAGLYLLGSSSVQKASRKLGAIGDQFSGQVGAGAEAVRQNVHDMQDLAADSLISAGESISSGLGSLKQQTSAAGVTLADGVDQLKDSAANFASSASDGMDDIKQKAADAFGAALRSGAAATRSFARNAAGEVTEFGADAAHKIRDRAVETYQGATSIINETVQTNPLLIGGLGLAAGMLIASALPPSDVEKRVVSAVGAEARKQANDLASKGFDAAKGIAAGVIADVAEHAVREGLSATDLHAAAEDLGPRVRKVAESATSAAFGSAK